MDNYLLTKKKHFPCVVYFLIYIYRLFYFFLLFIVFHSFFICRILLCHERTVCVSELMRGSPEDLLRVSRMP